MLVGRGIVINIGYSTLDPSTNHVTQSLDHSSKAASHTIETTRAINPEYVIKLTTIYVEPFDEDHLSITGGRLLEYRLQSALKEIIHLGKGRVL